MKVYELIERSSDDESDKHIEARDRRYSCLNSGFYRKDSILLKLKDFSQIPPWSGMCLTYEMQILLT